MLQTRMNLQFGMNAPFPSSLSSMLLMLASYMGDIALPKRLRCTEHIGLPHGNVRVINSTWALSPRHSTRNHQGQWQGGPEQIVNKTVISTRASEAVSVRHGPRGPMGHGDIWLVPFGIN